MNKNDILKLRKEIRSLNVMKVMEVKISGDENSEEVLKFKSIQERIRKI